MIGIGFLLISNCESIYQRRKAMQPNIAQKSPYAVEVEAGRSYYWCSCGLSKSQPFCDGSHKAGAFSPVEYIAEKDGTVYLCGCKHSQKPPFCDGTHTKL